MRETSEKKEHPWDSESLWTHPVWWKINLLARGAVWDNTPDRELLVTFALPGDISCTIMTGRHPGGGEIAVRDLGRDRVLLQSNGSQLEAEVQLDGELLQGELQTGIPLLGAVYPSGSWLATGFRAEGKVRTPLMSYDELEEAVRRAGKLRQVTGVMLAPPSTDRRTGGIALLEPYVTRLKNRTSHRVIVEVDPPSDYTWLEQVYAWGADGIFIPLVPTDSGNREEDLVYHRKAVEALAFAATVFPQGAVATSLDPQLGSVEANIDLAIELQDRSVLPLLYYTHLLGSEENALDGVLTLAATLKESGRPLPDRWLSGIGHLLSPGDLVSLLEGGRRSSLSLEQLYRTRLGSEALTRVGNLRRKLRLREQPGDNDRND